jgi:hypothetical protein
MKSSTFTAMSPAKLGGKFALEIRRLSVDPAMVGVAMRRYRGWANRTGTGVLAAVAFGLTRPDWVD